MKIVNLVQGTETWHQFRLLHNGASEAAAMLGLSKKVKRSELIRMKATGLAREFSEWVQEHVLDRGHELEALARPIVEAMIGEDLYPVTCEDGAESASCDGLTLGGELAFEHKQWSAELAESVRQGVVPEEHMPQCEQILMVTGAEKLLFVVSDGTAQNMVMAQVFPDPAWFTRIRDGWRQFDLDVAAYVPQAAAAPAPVGKAPETLPALRIEVTGAVTASNLSEFKQTALTAIRSVNRELKTDADFADAEKAVKWCADVESRLKAAKEHALSQTADIDALFKALDDIGAEAKAVRLDLDKLVKRRKDEVKEEAALAARRALDEHIAALNAEIAPMRLLPVAADFAGAIKGLRSIASMQDALDTTLATAKIAADTQARNIRANIGSFEAFASGFEFLFSDLSQIIHKHSDDFGLAVRARIDKHKADEAARLEQERARIRAEEAARLEREAAAKAAADARAAREAAEAQAKQEAENARPRDAHLTTNTPPQGAQQVLKAEATSPPDATDRATPASASPSVGSMGAGQPADAGPASGVVRALSRPAAPTELPTMTLGQISTRLGFSVTSDFLSSIGFEAHREKAAKLYRPSDFGAICAGISKHVLALAAERQAA